MEQMNLCFYPDDSKILETCISILSSKYFWVVKIEKQIRSFIFLVKLGLNGLVSRSTDLYQLLNRWLEILKVSHYSKHICTLMSEWLVVLTECRLLPAMPDSSPATDFDIRSSFLKLWRGLRSRFTLSFHNVTHLLYAFTFCPYARDIHIECSKQFK